MSTEDGLRTLMRIGQEADAMDTCKHCGGAKSMRKSQTVMSQISSHQPMRLIFEIAGRQ